MGAFVVEVTQLTYGLLEDFSRDNRLGLWLRFSGEAQRKFWIGSSRNVGGQILKRKKGECQIYDTFVPLLIF